MTMKNITETIDGRIRANCLCILEEHEEDGEDIMLETVIAAIRTRCGQDGLEAKMELAISKVNDDAE
jgi:hypothetical protein